MFFYDVIFYNADGKLSSEQFQANTASSALARFELTYPECKAVAVECLYGQSKVMLNVS